MTQVLCVTNYLTGQIMLDSVLSASTHSGSIFKNILGAIKTAAKKHISGIENKEFSSRLGTFGSGVLFSPSICIPESYRPEKVDISGICMNYIRLFSTRQWNIHCRLAGWVQTQSVFPIKCKSIKRTLSQDSPGKASFLQTSNNILSD